MLQCLVICRNIITYVKCFVFIIIMDVLASSIQRHTPWAMLFADDLVLSEESRLEVEQQLDSCREVLGGNSPESNTLTTFHDRSPCREVLAGNGLRISRKKTEYSCLYLRPAGSSEEVC